VVFSTCVYVCVCVCVCAVVYKPSIVWECVRRGD
jgi:hypothetical protein